MPLVSIVMAVHNSLKYLPEAFGSILDQTFSDFEFIIIDDGSTDGSTEWLRKACSEESRSKLLVQDQAGLTKSLNSGLAVASGEFVARMDADDVCFPDRIKKQVAFLRNNSDIVACGSNVELIDSDGDKLGFYRRPQTHSEIQFEFWNGFAGAIIHPSAMIRADAFKKIGGYNERYPKCQDYDLWFRLAEIGRLANMPEVLLQWRQHADSICYQFAEEQYLLRKEIYLDAAIRFGRDISKLPPIAKNLRQNPWDCHVEWAQVALHEQNFRTARKHSKIALRLLPKNSPMYKYMCGIRNGYQILRLLLQSRAGRVYCLFVKIQHRLKFFS